MIIFFGPAGSGKSLQGQILAARKEWQWLSSGQILRDSNDVELKEIMQTGQLVPNDKMNQIIGEALDKVVDRNKLILDGFPRQIDQAHWLVENGYVHGNSNDLVIVVDVPVDALIKRLSGRGRADDTPEIIEQRLKVYDQETTQILDYLTSQDVKVIRIDGSGKVGEIHDALMEELAECKLV
jgi:adenylate kinase